MNLFGKKQSPADQMREQNRVLRKAQRDIERDRKDLEKQEKLLEIEIKKAAKLGDKQLCTVLAKNLVQVRKQKGRNYTASSKIQSVGAQSKAMQSGAKLANTMAVTAKTMGAMNKEMNPQAMMKTMQDFEKESMKMGMAEEIVEDTLSSVLDESGDEEEQDSVINQVLDEIGIEISGKIAEAPSAHRGEIGESSRSKAQLPTDDELEKKLANLRT